MTPPRPAAALRWSLGAAVLVLLVAAGGVLALRPGAAEPRPPTRFALLQAGPGDDARARAAGATELVVELAWDRWAPAPGAVDAGYVAGVLARVDQVHDAGLAVVLDLGLQYPPDWVADTPGARFTDQDGAVAGGAPGERVVDAVFDPGVRAAQAAHLAEVAAALAPARVERVRVGGLHRGELSYPPPVPGRTSLWMYSPAGQAAAPVPGWRPGTGTTGDARRSTTHYLDALTAYGRWLLAETAAGFPAAGLDLLLPSWGLRPGEVAAALVAGLDGSSPGERTGALSQGLDWAAQVPLLSAVGARGTAWSTWLDGPSQGSGPQDRSPVEAVLAVARPLGVAVGGEGTGGGGAPALASCLDRLAALGLSGTGWRPAAELLDDPALVAAHRRAADRAAQ